MLDVLASPAGLLIIIFLGYTFKRIGIFGQKDYRIVQKIEFDLILPGAITYSFASNPHNLNLLWITGFGFLAAAIPPLLIFLTSRHTPVADRAFLMLNGAGFNVGCFCFPMVQSLIGANALVPAAMFDIGNCVMVAAGTNVLTQQLLHIAQGKTLAEQNAGTAPTLPYTKPTDPDARRLHRHSILHSIAHGFLSSPSFDTYLIMIALMLLNVHLPHTLAQVLQPFSGANAFCSMLMVGMMMDLPGNRHDVISVAKVIGWRLPCSVVAACSAWFLLPFDPLIRETVTLCCFAPVATFSTMFTDTVLGNARLAGFSLSLSAVISTCIMVAVHLLIHV